MRRYRLLIRGDSGQGLVEFALSSLIFFMTVFFIIECGLAVWQYNMTSDLAQEGARWAVVRGSTSSIVHATTAQVQDYVQSRSTGIAVTVTTPLGAPGTLAPGAPVSVQVETSFSPITAFIPHTTIILQSTATMVMAR